MQPSEVAVLFDSNLSRSTFPGHGISWTLSLLAIPLAANFGPGPDGAVRGCSV